METNIKYAIQKIPGINSITYFNIKKEKQYNEFDRLIDVYAINCRVIYDKEEIEFDSVINESGSLI